MPLEKFADPVLETRYGEAPAMAGICFILRRTAGERQCPTDEYFSHLYNIVLIILYKYE